MPVDKKKHTTASKDNASTSRIPEAEPLKPETFHQYLRAEIRQATRAVMEEILREELSQFLGAHLGQAPRNVRAIAMVSTSVI